MGKITKADFILECQVIGDSLTTIFGDTVLVGKMTPEFRHPSHPLRKIEKLFKMDGHSGAVSADEDYINAAYDGHAPSKGSGGFDQICSD